MRIAPGERFIRDVRKLRADERAAVFEVMLSLPAAFQAPHQHSGLGLRKLHESGIWEARLGLGLRMVFALAGGVATLDRLGTHDEVRRYLRSL